jgi:hypothetical protein
VPLAAAEPDLTAEAVVAAPAPQHGWRSGSGSRLAPAVQLTSRCAAQRSRIAYEHGLITTLFGMNNRVLDGFIDILVQVGLVRNPAGHVET